MRKELAVLSLLALGGRPSLGQAALPTPKFEIASVKRAAPSAVGGGFRGGPGTSDPGQITYSAVSLMNIVLIAYDMRAFRVSGPDWLNTDRYDVAAKVPDGTTKEQFQSMLQNLLTDRFHLSLHHETKEIPVYALSVGKNGPKLKESVGRSTPPKESLPAAFREFSPQTLSAIVATAWLITTTRVYMAGQERPASWIAESLQIPLGRPVVDQTGLTGKYDYYFDFAPEQRAPGAALSDTSNPAPSVFTAVQELGLKLEEKKLPFDVLVIDRADKVPTEN